MHLLAIVLSSIILIYIISNLIQFHPVLAILILSSSLFGMYYFMMTKYLRFQNLMSQTLSKVQTEVSKTAEIINGDSTLTFVKPLKLSQKFHLSSKEFEDSIQTALEYIQNSHDAIEELNRINYCKSSTLDTILAVSHHIMDLNTNEDFYQLILKSAIDVIENATKGSILTLNHETNRYEYQTAVGFNLEYLKKVDFALEETFLYMNGDGRLDKPMVISSVKDFDHTLLSPEKFEWLEKAEGLDTLEALSTPILVDNKIYAILNIDSNREHAFDDVDIQLIEFFSAQISIAIRNKLLVEETVKLSKFDKLTGAYNRNYFEKIFENHNEITLENLEPYAIVLCDLNFLKSINDTFGHTAGDLVLSEFSAFIQASIRDSDIFSRVGGDEFVLLLKNIPYSKAQEKMAKIFEKYEYHTINFNGHKLPVSFSYGLAASPDDSMVYDVLVKIADIRMYEFKKTYKESHQDILNLILQ